MKIYRLAQKKKKMQKPCFTAVRKKKIVDYRICIV